MTDYYGLNECVSVTYKTRTQRFVRLTLQRATGHRVEKRCDIASPSVILMEASLWSGVQIKISVWIVVRAARYIIVVTGPFCDVPAVRTPIFSKYSTVYCVRD